MANVPVKPASSLSSPSASRATSRVTLPDGSLAVLSEGAEIALEPSPDAGARVAVRQAGGRVRYEVRHDPAHPFLVHASTVTVRVLGTVFTVAFRDRGVAVSVDEGRVEIFDGRRRMRLGPGDELVVSQPEETAHSRSRRSTAEQESHRPVPEPPPSPADESTADAWMARADDARRAGNLAAAAEALQKLVDGHPKDTRVPAALFTLGTVERTAGHPEAATAAFARCRRQAPDGPLAEDALAAEATAWQAANDRRRAQTVAGEYLAQYPRGAHLVAMQEILR
jgi:transmembrane sensor